MPEVLRLATPDWTLSVWTRDILQPRETLGKTLKSRGAVVPVTEVRFSPPVVLSAAAAGGGVGSTDPLAEMSFPEPVFFENRAYDFEFEFTDACRRADPEIMHWLKGIQDTFRVSRGCLRGSVNFGNDVGWFRLGIRYDDGRGVVEQYLSFMVLPVKMDMAGDLERIHGMIDSAYPLWRFSFARRTDLELSKIRKPHERFQLLWLALFRGLRNDLERAVKLICTSPHSRLLPLERHLRPDRLKGRLAPRLEEPVTDQLLSGELHRRHRVETRRLSVDTPENRFVKMVLVRCEQELSSFTRKARLNNSVPEKERLSEAFFEELDSWITPLQRLLVRPLFREVGPFAGLVQESMVLQQRAGYAKVYRAWQDLKLYLDVFGRHAAVSMKSVDELYEVWCLLEMREILAGLGFSETPSRKAALVEKDFEKQLRDGMGTAFHFSRRDGLHIRLAHEPPFHRPGKAKSGIFSWITRQVPDILLEATFPDGSRIRWIFDAKYRIDTADSGEDLIPDDAINQMHRYRDALVHVTAADDEITVKSRPVVGAFVLYPGFFDEEAGGNPYAEAIEAVGVGGFPLLPGHKNLWLKAFLKEKFADLSESAPKAQAQDPDLHLLHESVRIAPTGLLLSRYKDLALATTLGPGRDQRYLEKFRNGTAGWYHVPAETAVKKKLSPTIMRELRYCAVAVHDSGDNNRHIHYVYDVLSIEPVRRCDLSIEQAGLLKPGDTTEFWLLKLGAAERLNLPVRIGGLRGHKLLLTSMVDLLLANQWCELRPRYPFLMKE